VDTSVWVNEFAQREAGHGTSPQLLEMLRTRVLPIIVPNLVLAEVAGVINRTCNDPVRAEVFVTTLGRLPNVTGVALDAAVAQQAGCSLIVPDHEHLTRLGSMVMVHTPAVLAELISPMSPSPAR
jgi:predicted nucleic acid-binding protein